MVGKWVPASAGKAKAGMFYSVSGCTRGVPVKLWDPLRTRAIPERIRCVITTRRYTNPRLPYLTLHQVVMYHIAAFSSSSYYLCQQHEDDDDVHPKADRSLNTSKYITDMK